MKSSKLLATGASFLAAAMLFAGCAGVTHEPKVDMAAQADIDDGAFMAALEKIGVDNSDMIESQSERTMPLKPISFLR